MNVSEPNKGVYMYLKRNRKGFTLLEILIVIVILGVVAGLAVPVFTGNVKKSYAQEVYASCDAYRGAQQRYVGANGAFGTVTQIGYDPASAGTQTLHYSINAPTLTAGTSFTVTYTCTGSGCTAADKVDCTNTGLANAGGIFA